MRVTATDPGKLTAMLTAAAAYSLDGGWNTALAAGSVVLITGGVVAMIKKSMRPAQALAVLVTAVVVGGISLLATGFPSAVFTSAIVATTTVGGVAIAIAVITRPAPRRL